MGLTNLNLKNNKQKPARSKAENLKIIADNISDDNAEFLAEIAMKPKANAVLAGAFARRIIRQKVK